MNKCSFWVLWPLLSFGLAIMVYPVRPPSLPQTTGVDKLPLVASTPHAQQRLPVAAGVKPPFELLPTPLAQVQLQATSNVQYPIALFPKQQTSESAGISFLPQLYAPGHPRQSVVLPAPRSGDRIPASTGVRPALQAALVADGQRSGLVSPHIYVPVADIDQKYAATAGEKALSSKHGHHNHHSSSAHDGSKGHKDGGGHKEHGSHKEIKGHKSSEGHKSAHDHYSGRKGETDKEKHVKETEEKGGKHTSHHDEDSHGAKHHEHEKGGHGSKHKEHDKYKKKGYTKGFRDKYHKDEYHKLDKYWSNNHESGKFNKYGEHGEHYHIHGDKHDKGGKHAEGSKEEKHGNKGEYAKGHKSSDQKGHKGHHGHEEKHGHQTHYDKKVDHKSQHHNHKHKQ